MCGINSTEQLNQTQLKNLRAISTTTHSLTKLISNTDFINYDYNNLYRTTYTDMSTKQPKLLNTHYIPCYAGFVPTHLAQRIQFLLRNKSITLIINVLVEKQK